MAFTTSSSSGPARTGSATPTRALAINPFTGGGCDAAQLIEGSVQLAQPGRLDGYQRHVEGAVVNRINGDCDPRPFPEMVTRTNIKTILNMVLQETAFRQD